MGGSNRRQKLSSQSASELPLNGRDFSSLLLLAAETMTDVNGATNFTQQFAINGATSRSPDGGASSSSPSPPGC
jgi:hypothetical protein